MDCLPTEVWSTVHELYDNLQTQGFLTLEAAMNVTACLLGRWGGACEDLRQGEVGRQPPFYLQRGVLQASHPLRHPREEPACTQGCLSESLHAAISRLSKT